MEDCTVDWLNTERPSYAVYTANSVQGDSSVRSSLFSHLAFSEYNLAWWYTCWYQISQATSTTVAISFTLRFTKPKVLLVTRIRRLVWRFLSWRQFPGLPAWLAPQNTPLCSAMISTIQVIPLYPSGLMWKTSVTEVFMIRPGIG